MLLRPLLLTSSAALAQPKPWPPATEFKEEIKLLLRNQLMRGKARFAQLQERGRETGMWNRDTHPRHCAA
jgi:hypothetical protein